MLKTSEQGAETGLKTVFRQVRPKRVGQWKVTFEDGQLIVGYSLSHTFVIRADSTSERDKRRLQVLIRLAHSQSPVKPGGLFLSSGAMPFTPVFLEVLGPLGGAPKRLSPNPLESFGGLLARLRLNPKVNPLGIPRSIRSAGLVSLLLLGLVWGDATLTGNQFSGLTAHSGNFQPQDPTPAGPKSMAIALIQRLSEELVASGVSSASEIEFVTTPAGSSYLQVALDSRSSSITLGAAAQVQQERLEKTRRAVATVTGGTVVIVSGKMRSEVMSLGGGRDSKGPERQQVTEDSLRQLTRRYGVVSEVSSSRNGLRLVAKEQPIQVVDALITDSLMQQNWTLIRLVRGSQQGLVSLETEMSQVSR